MTGYTKKATLAMFRLIGVDTYKKYSDWFKEHPDEPYCYWTRDEFEPITIEDAKDPEKVARHMKLHPEIDDINDHTLAHMENDKLVIDNFCPKFKANIDAVMDGLQTYDGNVDGKILFSVSRAEDRLGRSNYSITVEKA